MEREEEILEEEEDMEIEEEILEVETMKDIISHFTMMIWVEIIMKWKLISIEEEILKKMTKNIK